MAGLTSYGTNPAGPRLAGPRLDLYLLLSFLILLTVGLMSVFSVSATLDGGTFFRKQMLATAIGVVPFLIFALVPPRVWRRASNFVYAANVVLLLSVLLFGKEILGARRWLDLGPLQFQPSELAKLLTILSLSAFYANREETVDRLSTFLLSIVHVAVPMVLIMLAPSLGATMVIVVLWLAISLLARVPLKFVAAAVGVLLMLVVMVFTVPALSKKVLRGYQAERIQGLKEKNRREGGYQTWQAEIAFGLGGVSGSGFLKGEQKAAGMIPEQESDFIFTVIGEEGGLIGTTLVLSAFGFFFYRVWLVMVHAADRHQQMIAGGIFAILGFHTFMNMAMVLQIIPVVGQWLPFFSYGGTAMWLCMACVGLLLNMRARVRPILFG